MWNITRIPHIFLVVEVQQPLVNEAAQCAHYETNPNSVKAHKLKSDKISAKFASPTQSAAAVFLFGRPAVIPHLIWPIFTAAKFCHYGGGGMAYIWSGP